MKVITMYTIPGFNFNFNSAVKVFAFLKKESLKMPVNVATCLPSQIIRCTRTLQYRNQTIVWLQHLCESSIAGYDDRDVPFMIKSIRERVVNTLIRKNIYLGVMDADLLPIANLSEQEFTIKYSHYELLLWIAHGVILLYSEDDVSDVVLPSTPDKIDTVTQKLVCDKGIKFKPEHYMKMHFNNGVLHRPSLTMLKGLIQFHLDRQYILSKSTHSTSFENILLKANALREVNSKVTQRELYEKLGVGMKVIKQIKKIWKDEKNGI